MSLRFPLQLLLLLPILLPAVPAAAVFESAENIRAAAIATVPDRNADGVRVEAVVTDGLQLPACPTALTAYAGPLGTAEVGCPAARWQLHVPVRIQRVTDVLVVARTLAAGEVIEAGSLRVEQRDVGRLPAGILGNPARAIGLPARRALPAGTLLSVRDLAGAPSIQRGDSVTLVVRRGGLEVRAPGRALGSAAPRERLRAENQASRRIVQGILQDNGEILVP